MVSDYNHYKQHFAHNIVSVLLIILEKLYSVLNDVKNKTTTINKPKTKGINPTFSQKRGDLTKNINITKHKHEQRQITSNTAKGKTPQDLTRRIIAMAETQSESQLSTPAKTSSPKPTTKKE